MLNIDIGQRFIAACTHCRQGKTKCSRGQPCTRCTKKGLDCIYLKSSRPMGESKRFYDQTGDNLFLFKCESNEEGGAPKKKRPSNPVSVATNSSCPSYTEGSSTASPAQLSSPSSLSVLSNQFLFPMLKIIELPKPNIEFMIHDFDKYLYFKATTKFDLGKAKITQKFVVKQCEINCHEHGRSFIGCDYLPVFETIPEPTNINCVLETHLLILYFNNINPYFPAIDRKIFFNKLRTDPTSIDPLLLNSICYAACPQLAFNGLYKDKCHYKLAHHFHHQALRLLDQHLKNPTIITLQAMLLLYNGQCNLVDDLNFKQYEVLNSLKSLFEMSNLFSEDERREMMNLWWCCYLQDKICNTSRSKALMLPSDKYQFFLPKDLVLDTIVDPLDLPGSSFCQLAFTGQILLAQAIEAISKLPNLEQVSSETLLNSIGALERQLSDQQQSVHNHFDPSAPNLITAIALFIYRFYFHSAHILLYIKALNLYQISNPDLARRFLYKATQSASSAIFLCDIMNFDYFQYGPLLTLNNILLAYKAFHHIIKSKESSLSSIASFGLDRCILTNVRNINYRIGLNIKTNRSKELLAEFLNLTD